MANKINQNAQEQTENPPQTMQQMFEMLVKMSSFVPVMICGVNRKANTGGFENLDIYTAITVPVMYDITSNDYLEFKRAAEEAAKIGFSISSKETMDRYTIVKNNQAGGRPDTK